MADIKDADSRSKNMSAIKSRDTKPELIIRKALFADGYRYRVAPGNVLGHPDIYLPKYKVAVFVHGCFWHRHEGCRYAYVPKSRTDFWNTKFINNINRDKVVRKGIKEAGIRCIIVWECAIKKAQKKPENMRMLIKHIEELIASDVVECEVEAGEGVQTWRDNYNCL